MGLKPDDAYTNESTNSVANNILEAEPLRALIGGVTAMNDGSGGAWFQPATLSNPGDLTTNSAHPRTYWGSHILGSVTGTTSPVPFGMMRAVMEAYNTEKTMGESKNKPRPIGGPFLDAA
ncbi:MAG: hypothetical protein KAH38_05850, partial [Candidatus Hydrogenedentes bacterium]|nr:hypothetical protein [Candidatus Hydrogenedentota bacterium]